ncbi:MAG: helix-turn-helix transcriptional regulator [Thalassotalea sp.]|nr:helix-turn-helix transcriptional regulator [Thalassotalea sp.]
MAVNVIPTIIYSSMMGVMIFALYELCSSNKSRQFFYLLGLQLLLLIHILGELFIYSGAYRFAPSLAGAQFPIRMLLGPALYFYAFASMSPDKGIPKKALIIAVLGPVIVILGMLPFIACISPEEKLSLANPATRDPGLYQFALYTCLFAMIAFITYTSVYLVAAFKLQKKHRTQLMERFSDIEKRSMDWLSILLMLWGGVWLLFTVDFGINFLGIRWFGTGLALPLIEAIVVMVFCHYSLRQSSINEEEKGKSKGDQAKTSTLAKARMKQIANKLAYEMNENSLFLAEDLSLRRLSDAISVSENHISETFSQFLHTNFFQYINNFRIEYAMTQLVSTNKTMMEIAYDAGFNSKSTFNSAFKKVAGITPTVYRKQA